MKNIIEMALDFSGMQRVFAEKSKRKILQKVEDAFSGFDRIHTKEDYERMHSEFCLWFAGTVLMAAKKETKTRKAIPERASSYGHAAKVLDIAAKVFLHYCAMPALDVAQRLRPMLHSGLDNKMVKRLIRKFPSARIASQSLEDIDQLKYGQLQALVAREIAEEFGSQIYPVEYDDILFRRLNRPE